MRAIVFILAAWVTVIANPGRAQSYELDESDPRVARSLAAMQEGQAATAAGDQALAEQRFREALSLRSDALGKDHWATGNAALQLALVQYWTGAKEAGFANFEAALTAYRETRPELAATALDEYALALENDRRFGRAEEMRRAAIEALSYSDFSERDREELLDQWRMRLGTILRWQGRNAEAIALLQAYVDAQDGGTPESARSLAVPLFDLASARRDAADEATALAIFERLVTALEGDEHDPSDIYYPALQNVASILARQGRHDESIAMLLRKQAHIVAARPGSLAEAEAAITLAKGYYLASRSDEIWPALDRAFSILAKEDPARFHEELLEWAKVAFEEGRTDVSEDYVRRAVEAALRTDDEVLIALAYQRLGWMFARFGRIEQAASYAEAVLRKLDELPPGVDVLRANTYSLVATIALARDDPDAEASIRRALDLFERLEKDKFSKANTAVTLDLLGRYLQHAGRDAEAADAFARCAALFGETAGMYEANLARCRFAEGRALVAAGRAEGEAKMLAGLAAARPAFGERSPTLIGLIGALGASYLELNGRQRESRHWLKEAGARAVALTRRGATEEPRAFAEQFSDIYKKLVRADWELYSEQASN